MPPDCLLYSGRVNNSLISEASTISKYSLESTLEHILSLNMNPTQSVFNLSSYLAPYYTHQAFVSETTKLLQSIDHNSSQKSQALETSIRIADFQLLNIGAIIKELYEYKNDLVDDTSYDLNVPFKQKDELVARAEEIDFNDEDSIESYCPTIPISSEGIRIGYLLVSCNELAQYSDSCDGEKIFHYSDSFIINPVVYS